MNKFSRLLENTFRSSNLKRVRLKVDPAYCERGEISKYQGYEGYILAEKEKESKVYIECGCSDTMDVPEIGAGYAKQGVVAMVPNDMLELTAGPSKMEKLKMYALMYLKETKNVNVQDALVQMIMNSSTLEMLETYLSNNGCSDKDIIAIYRMGYEE